MNNKMILMAAAAALVLTGCVKEIAPERSQTDDVVITATASAPGAFVANENTKVAYKDNFKVREDIVDISASWEDGDSFTALEINGSNITKVVFTAKGEGKTAVFTSSGAEAADDNTSWIAVTGNVDVVDNTFVCKYDGQDGSLANIAKYDYSVAKATGKTPDFNFAKGERLSYLMRILLPEGIASFEFNTGEALDGGCTVTSDGKVRRTTSTPVKAAVKTVAMKSTSTKGQIAYLSIPAMNYSVGEGDSKNRLGGLIITVFSPDKKRSQGKTTSKDLSASGGCLGTFDMSGLALMARPLASEAVKLGSVTYDNVTYQLGSWAPFNLGGDFPLSDNDIKGGIFAWGETEPKTSFTRDGYKYYNSGTYQTQIGYKYETPSEGASPCIHVSASGGSSMNDGPGTFYDIRGTKYDAARVKWGSEWCLPSNAVANNACLTGGGSYLSQKIDKEGKVQIMFFAAGTYKNAFSFTSPSMGACVIKANGAELALYATPFTDDGKMQSGGSLGRYYTSTSDYGVYNTSGFQGYWNRAVQIRMNTTDEIYINNKSWQWDGLAIRPILNED